MFNKIKLYLKNFDWLLFASVIVLISIGLAEIYSIALSKEQVELMNFKKQVLFVGVGVVILFLFTFIDYHNLSTYSNYFYLLGLGLLAAVLFFGHTVRGTKGWFSLGGMNLQPVEFIKIVLILFLARYFSIRSIKLSSFKHFMATGIGCLILVFLILKQPDFGSALILILLWISILIMAGINKKYLIIMSLLLVAIMVLGWYFFFADYQKQRIMTFLNPQSQSLDQGYNISQAIIAVGSGGIMGRGIGFGSQSQLKFLPESQNDFIFAVISEELGFVGVLLVLVFFALLFFRLLINIRKINDDFAAYFLIGFTSLIFIEMFINIGMNIGLLPVVGISLPFISYGGSAIISTFIMIGIVENIIIRSKLKY